MALLTNRDWINDPQMKSRIITTNETKRYVSSVLLQKQEQEVEFSLETLADHLGVEPEGAQYIFELVSSAIAILGQLKDGNPKTLVAIENTISSTIIGIATTPEEGIRNKKPKRSTEIKIIKELLEIKTEILREEFGNNQQPTF